MNTKKFIGVLAVFISILLALCAFFTIMNYISFHTSTSECIYYKSYTTVTKEQKLFWKDLHITAKGFVNGKIIESTLVEVKIIYPSNSLTLLFDEEEINKKEEEIESYSDKHKFKCEIKSKKEGQSIRDANINTCTNFELVISILYILSYIGMIIYIVRRT